MVSLPALTSRNRATEAAGDALRATPSISARLPKPSRSSVGSFRPPAAFAVFAIVLTDGPSSKARTSGAAPIPPESMTSTTTAGPGTALAEVHGDAALRLRSVGADRGDDHRLMRRV